MKSFAVVRSDDISRVKIALRDLIRYAHLIFVGKARILEPAFADNILVSVMRSPLRSCCEAASIVPLEDDASVAIAMIKKIHPPAHIIIVSPRHEIFYELAELVDMLPEIELEFIEDEDEDEDDATGTVEDNRANIFRDNRTMVEEANKIQIEDNNIQIEGGKLQIEGGKIKTPGEYGQRKYNNQI